MAMAVAVGCMGIGGSEGNNQQAKRRDFQVLLPAVSGSFCGYSGGEVLLAPVPFTLTLPFTHTFFYILTYQYSSKAMIHSLLQQP